MRHLVADFLPVHAMAFDGVVGAAGEEWHARAGPSAADGFHDLLARQLSLAQRQRVAAVTTAAVPVPLMAAETVATLEYRPAGTGWIRGRGRLAEHRARRRQHRGGNDNAAIEDMLPFVIGLSWDRIGILAGEKQGRIRPWPDPPVRVRQQATPSECEHVEHRSRLHPLQLGR